MSTFRLPDLGEGLAEAEILEWHVAPGDHVVADQPMVSVETAKAVVEVPVPYSGTVIALHGASGDIVATGAPLIDFDSLTVVGTMPATPAQEFVDSAVLGRASTAGGTRRRALPVARALARHLGLDLDRVQGSGSGGEIVLDDVLARVQERNPAPLEIPSGAVREPLRGSRRAMARSMTTSHASVPASTVFDDADIHAWSTRGDYMLRLTRAMIRAQSAEPALNAWYDPAANARILFKHIDLAVAVDTPQGLIVPVVRAIQDKTPDELRSAFALQKTAAHERTLAAEELRGFTLMLSNFGTLAGRYGIPLVVPPAVAILGAGKVRVDVIAVGEAVAAHRRMPLSLSFDHRCVTGGEACRFLAAAIVDLERPD